MAYELVGRLDRTRTLADLAPRLSPVRSQEGYATTDREATRALYRPRLESVFPGEWTHCTLAIIWPAGSIPPHADGCTASERAQRYMVVLQSGSDSWCLHDGTWQQLEEGGIYTADPAKTHAAVHWGLEPRIHFIVDVRRESA